MPTSLATTDAGYTLLELLVVVALVAMVLSAMPGVYGQLVPSYRVRQFAEDLANHARALREHARSHQVVTEIRYVQSDQAFLALGEDISVPASVTVEFTASSIMNHQSDQDGGSVSFYPTGTSTGGTFNISGNGMQTQVVINWLSGAIEVRQ